MPLPPDDRRRMRAVRLCGPRVISRLEAAGVTSFAELADADPDELVFRVNLAAGRPIWHPPMATRRWRTWWRRRGRRERRSRRRADRSPLTDVHYLELRLAASELRGVGR